MVGAVDVWLAGMRYQGVATIYVFDFTLYGSILCNDIPIKNSNTHLFKD